MIPMKPDFKVLLHTFTGKFFLLPLSFKAIYQFRLLWKIEIKKF